MNVIRALSVHLRVSTQFSHHNSLYVLILALLIPLHFSCQSPAPPDAPTEDSAQTTPDPPPPDPLLTQFQNEMEALINQRAQSSGMASHLQSLLADRQSISLSNWRREVFLELYQSVHFSPVFVFLDGTLTHRYQSLIETIRTVDLHALDPANYHLDALEELATEISLQEEPLFPASWSVSEADLEILVQGWEDREELSSSEMATRFLDALLPADGDPPVEAFFNEFLVYQNSIMPLLAPRARMELLLQDAFFSYTRDMKLGNTNRMSEGELLEAGGSGQVVADRLRAAFHTALSSDENAFRVYLSDLIPRYSQYVLLQTSLLEYREYVSNGGWERVSPRNLELGDDHPRVSQLKTRLAAEGYFLGTINTLYDEELETAVTAYQETHQMAITGSTVYSDGRSHSLFWQSLNMTAAHRLNQIELTIQRWRESRIGDDNYFIFVNVPDFHAEFWRDGERLHRFRVVIGNRQQECDPETNTMRYINATPLISAELEYMIFNPYWNVPPRIRREEIELEIIENPGWLVQNGYEVVVTDGNSRIRQLPGPDNALGQVKFIFPNTHNIYMHDTPHQRFFSLDIRSYSHGCIRVHEPLILAEHILTEDGRSGDFDIENILELAEEKTITLRENIPVHIEYYVVRVDEEGRTHFLSDIYRYDRQRIQGDAYEPEECEIDLLALEAQQSIIWEEDGSGRLPDGTIVRVDGSVDLSSARIENIQSAKSDSTEEGDAEEDPPPPPPQQEALEETETPGSDFGP